MEILLIVLAVLLGAGLLYLLFLDGNFQVRRSLEIKAPKQRVFEEIVDFHTWPSWSPWLLHEPGAQITYEDPKGDFLGAYSWKGKMVGAGRLAQVERKGMDEVKLKIDFIKPFKSSLVVRFELAEKNGATEVSWLMEGKMPFFFKPMIPAMKQMIGFDYDIGLNFLNGRLDKSASTMKIEFNGVSTVESGTLIGKPFEGGIEALSGILSGTFGELGEYFSKQGIENNGISETVYLKMDTKKMHFSGFAGMRVPSEMPTGHSFEIFETKGGEYFRTTLTGDYRFLCYGWYAAFSHLRMKKIKPDKSRHSFEKCLVSPNHTDNPNEYKTDIFIPVR